MFRVALYVAAAVSVAGLVGIGLSVLGASVVVAGFALLLTGETHALGIGLLASVGLAPVVLAACVAVAARRLDRHVTASDRRPDPLDELRAQYVADEIDESTFERRVERVLVGESADDPTGGRLRRCLRALRLLRSFHVEAVSRRRARRSIHDRTQESEPELPELV